MSDPQVPDASEPNASVSVPDPSWSVAELLRAACAAQCLSADWLPPLSRVDPLTLTSSQRVAWAVATNRLTAVVEELSLRALDSVPSQPCAPAGTLSTFPDQNADPEDIHSGDGPGPCEGGLRCPHTWEVEELTALMRLGRRRVISRRRLGRELAGRYACVRPLLAGGQIGLGHLILLSDQLQHCTEATASLVAEQVSVRAARQAPQAFARSVSRALARCISPEEAATRHTRAVKASSGVSFWPREDGLLGMGVTGSVEKIEALRALFATHPAINRPHPQDTRTKGERHVDFLLDACTHTCTHATTSLTNPATAAPASDAPAPGAPAAATSDPAPAAAATSPAPAACGEVAIGVVITASIETLEGLSNEPGMVGETVTDAATIRHLAADRRWARGSLYDRRGINLTLGRAVRFPSKAQRIAVGVKNPRCVFPGCSRNAAGSEIDHNKAWEHGGRTDLTNLYPLCTLHHHLKHQPGWTCQARRDGTLLWTLPHGQHIVVQPQDYRVPPGPYDRTHTQLDQQHQEAIDDARHEAWLTWAIANDPGDNHATHT